MAKAKKKETIPSSFLFINRNSKPTRFKKEKLSEFGANDVEICYSLICFKDKEKDIFKISFKVFPTIEVEGVNPIELEQEVPVTDLALLFGFCSLPRELFIAGEIDVFYLRGDYNNEECVRLAEDWNKQFTTNG